MFVTLSHLVSRLSWDPAQHPNGQERLTPFHACTVSGSEPITLTLEQVPRGEHANAGVRLTARNNTLQTIPFVRAMSPTELFSVSVLQPDGNRARVTEGTKWLYGPPPPHGSPARAETAIRHGHTFLPLPPNQDVSWFWPVGDDFVMTAPGTYRVTLGGAIPYLAVSLCSNTADVVVK